MVFDYQEKVIGNLIGISEKLEELTEDRLELKIGYIKSEIYCGDETWVTDEGDLYLLVNQGNVFRMIGDIMIDEFDVMSSEASIKFDDDLDVRLCEWISNINMNKHKSKLFHKRLSDRFELINSLLGEEIKYKEIGLCILLR